MRIAVADDERGIRDFMSSLLTSGGHDCFLFDNGMDLISAAPRGNFNLAIIDNAIPYMGGPALVRQLRQILSPCPAILMLMDSPARADIDEALKAGADDYLIHPEPKHVTLARIRRLTRANGERADQLVRTEQFGAYCFNLVTRTVIIGDEEITLTAREFQLAYLFFCNPDRAFSRSYILENLWNCAPDLHTRTLDMHVSRLRSKLRLCEDNGYRLQAIFGHGYRLETSGPG